MVYDGTLHDSTSCEPSWRVASRRLKLHRRCRRRCRVLQRWHARKFQVLRHAHDDDDDFNDYIYI